MERMNAACREAEILFSAVCLARRHGLSKLTCKMVADELDISVSLVRYYMQNQRTLWRRVGIYAKKNCHYDVARTARELGVL